MAQKKGQTGNIAGRPKGSPNKINSVLKESIDKFLQTRFTSFKKDLKLLSPRDRVQAYLKLLEFGLPKQQRTTLDVDFDSMSDGQLSAIIEGLINREA